MRQTYGQLRVGVWFCFLISCIKHRSVFVFVGWDISRRRYTPSRRSSWNEYAPWCTPERQVIRQVGGICTETRKDYPDISRFRVSRWQIYKVFYKLMGLAMRQTCGQLRVGVWFCFLISCIKHLSVFGFVGWDISRRRYTPSRRSSWNEYAPWCTPDARWFGR